MKEHFQLFCGAMVRAILEGHKVMTRRLVSPENSLLDGKSARTLTGKALWGRLDWSNADADDDGRNWIVGLKDGVGLHIVSPYVRMGDVLIGKETFVIENSMEYERVEPVDRPFRWTAPIEEGGVLEVPHYRATEPEPHIVRVEGDLADDRTIWRPSIFMPRWASRLRLEVTLTRPERLQDISEADVLAEGVRIPCHEGSPVLRLTGKYRPADYWPVKTWAEMKKLPNLEEVMLRAEYAGLWDSLNERVADRWQDNPPVWVRSFKRL